jgi:hypothetical protein
MLRTFVETSAFTKKVDHEGGPELLRQIQTEVLERLESGSVIQGTGGLRKLRVADSSRGKGKRGGYRVIYLDLSESQKTFLIGLYDKDEKVDISNDEKRALRALILILKREAKTHAEN